MSKSIGGILRTTGLVILIASASTLETILIYRNIPFWKWVVPGLTLIILIAEVYGMIAKKKTISTMWKDWAIREPLWAYSALGLFFTAMAGLTLHLAVW